MKTYILTLGKGLQGPARMNGALFLGDRHLHFLCASLGVTGGYDFSAFGAVGAALEEYKKTGNSPMLAESDVAAAVAAAPHSFSIPVENVELLSRAFCAGSKIVHEGGKKLVVWSPGFAGQFRAEAKVWAEQKRIRTDGL
jgi:hypothetical protein